MGVDIAVTDHELSIGAVAERAVVDVSALRFYEAGGLISSRRSEGGQRRYARSVLRRVAFIQVAQRVGLTLEEIGRALATLFDDDGLTTGCRLRNPGDRAALLGPGPRYLPGDGPVE